MNQASSMQEEVVEMPAGAPVEIRSRSTCSRPIDGAAGVSVRIHLIHHPRFCSVKLSTQSNRTTVMAGSCSDSMRLKNIALLVELERLWPNP
jgi:hypothetical protein